MIFKKIEEVKGGLQVSSGIKVEAGTINQEMLVDGEYYPDRMTYPLILQPFCGYTDATTGKNTANAMPEVTDGNWYRLTDTNRHLGLCEATKITSALTGQNAAGETVTLYTVVSTAGAADYGRLTVKENVPPGENITYVFTGTLSTDGRHLEMYFNSRSDSVSEVPDILFDNNDKGVYNPLVGERYFTINPRLSDGSQAIWKWKSYHELEGGWIESCTSPLDWAIGLEGNGIKIDRERMPDMVYLMCYAEIVVDGVTVVLERPVTHTRILPRIEFDHDDFLITRDVTTICPQAFVKCGNIIVEDEKEVSVKWYNKAGACVGRGFKPTIPLSSLGADRQLALDVKDRGGRSALISNGSLVTSDGAIILVRSKIND